MIQKPQLKMSVEAVEKGILHLYNKTNDFHPALAVKPQEKEAQEQFLLWHIRVKGFLLDAFTTPEVGQEFRAIIHPLETNRYDEIQYGQMVLTCIKRSLDFLDDLRIRLPIFEVTIEPKTTQEFSDRDLMLRAIELARQCV